MNGVVTPWAGWSHHGWGSQTPGQPQAKCGGCRGDSGPGQRFLAGSPGAGGGLSSPEGWWLLPRVLLGHQSRWPPRVTPEQCPVLGLKRGHAVLPLCSHLFTFLLANEYLMTLLGSRPVFGALMIYLSTHLFCCNAAAGDGGVLRAEAPAQAQMSHLGTSRASLSSLCSQRGQEKQLQTSGQMVRRMFLLEL